MEKEEQKWEQEEVEDEQEEEETSLQVRKSRPVNDTKSTEISILETEGSNGTPESNGNEVHSTVTANGTKDFESTLENGDKKDEPDGVVGNEEDISNGLQKSDNLVYFDKDKGIWKCQICSWIYRNGSACVDHMQNHKGQLHKLMNDKTLNNETGGNEITSLISGDQQIEKSNGHNELDILSQEFSVLLNSTSAVNGGSEGHLDDDSLPYSNLQHNGIRDDDGLSNSDLQPSGEIESEEIYVIPGDELEVTEIDVEQVLQKQTTHDLYCPNCNSCITRRVILRKRKRRIRLSAQDIKRNKLDAVADSKLDAGSSQVSSTVVHEKDYFGVDNAPLLGTYGTDRDREPDLFRCFSCFSIFFPTGNGFKLFRIFEGKKVKVNVQEEQVPSTKKNSSASMLPFNKQETAVARGSKSREYVRKGDMGMGHMPSSDIIDHNGQPSSAEEGHPPGQASDISLPKQGHTVKTTVPVGAVADKTAEKIEATIEHFEAYTSDQLQESKSVKEAQTNHGTNLSTKTPLERTHVTNEELSEDVISSSKGGMNFLISSNEEFLTVEKPNEGRIPNQKIQIRQGKDTVITIDAQSVGSSQTGQNIVYPEETKSALHSAPQVTVADTEGTEVRNEFEIEVIKSIVYGGLTELITSLSVVSSAAGGGAATLNILALGIASLIGGIFVICHNLWELRSECIEQSFNHVGPVIEQRDRYKELLGRKENFVLHAIVSILSYIIFGLVAPVTYGFSFRKSDNKEFKLIVVAAASLLCICGLAVGRAYVRRSPKPYVKSVVTYVILGFMVSGVSYVAGVLVERILEKLGLFHSSSGANILLPQLETVPSYSGWTSY